MINPQLQIKFGDLNETPINQIICGNFQTMHHPEG